MDGDLAASQQNLPYRLAERRPARIAARDHVAALLAQPITEKPLLRGLPHAVNSLERKEVYVSNLFAPGDFASSHGRRG